MPTRLLLILTGILTLSSCAFYKMEDEVMSPLQKMHNIEGYVFGKFYLDKRFEESFYTPVVGSRSALRIQNLETKQFIYIELRADNPYRVIPLTPGAYRIEGVQHVSGIGLPDSLFHRNRQLTVDIEFDIVPKRMVYVGDYDAIMYKAEGTFKSNKTQLRVSNRFNDTVARIESYYPSFAQMKKFNPIRR